MQYIKILSVAREILPKAFKGSQAAKNTELLNKIGFIRSGEKLVGLKNGIAVIEDAVPENHGTTTVRKFLGLDDKGELVSLRNKAIYKCNPSELDRRSISDSWKYDYKTNMTTKRSSVSVDGKLKEVTVYKENSNNSDVAGLFYHLASLNKNFKSFTKLDYSNGTYSKMLQDISGNRGLGVEYGRLSGNGVKEKISSMVYNPNLGQLMGKDWIPSGYSFYPLQLKSKPMAEFLKEYLTKK